MGELVNIETLTAGYNNVPVFQNVNLRVFEKDFLGIIGPNGSGKTTLLKTILGLVKPMEGKIEFSPTMKLGNTRIGYLPQVKHIDRKFPIRVIDVVKSGYMNSRQSNAREEQNQQVMDLLHEMGIFDIRNKAIGELSGGQLQRVFLCRAIAGCPKLLVLDEPDSFIDAIFGQELYEKLRVLNNEMAIIIVSHDFESISGFVKSVACISGGLHQFEGNKISRAELDQWIREMAQSKSSSNPVIKP